MFFMVGKASTDAEKWWNTGKFLRFLTIMAIYSFLILINDLELSVSNSEIQDWHQWRIYGEGNMNFMQVVVSAAVGIKALLSRGRIPDFNIQHQQVMSEYEFPCILDFPCIYSLVKDKGIRQPNIRSWYSQCLYTIVLIRVPLEIFILPFLKK